MSASRTPSTGHPTVTVSLRMPEETKTALQRLAAQDDRTLNWYLVRVLTEHLAEQEGKR